jgi:hypothetical protein
MAKEPLVNADIEAAQRLVAFLDSNGLPVSTALWLYESEAERWRFLVAIGSRKARKSPISYYNEVANLIHAKGSGLDLLELGSVEFVDSKEPVVSRLSQFFTGESAVPIRLSHTRVNDLYVEDALIYRLAA